MWFFVCPVCGYLTKTFKYVREGITEFDCRVLSDGKFKLDRSGEIAHKEYLICDSCNNKVYVKYNDIVVKIEKIDDTRYSIKWVGRIWNNISRDKLSKLEKEVLEQFKEMMRKKYGILID